MARRYALGPLFGEGRDEFVQWVPHCGEIGALRPRGGVLRRHARPLARESGGRPRAGVVFGGVITTLLDQAGGAATMCSLEEIVPIATIDLRVDSCGARGPGTRGRAPRS